MLPQHGNLGDQAISLAEIFFLKQTFKKIQLVYNLYNYSNHINNNSLIFLHGGGNIGWRYSYEEKNRRTIIEQYQNNRIIIFPQTIDFEKNKKEEKETQIIYSRHKNLTLIAREKVSFSIMNKLFKNNTILFSPDIVTYLDNLIDLKNNKRKGALFLLRNDKEKILKISFKKKIVSLIKKIYKHVNFTDTAINKRIMTFQQSKEEVSNKLRQIASFEIVITDRLHGMIFCAITQTSCIILRNFNHKISSSSEWFKHLKYIKFLDEFDIGKAKILIESIKKEKTKNIYDKKYFNKYYDYLKEYFLNSSFS